MFSSNNGHSPKANKKDLINHEFLSSEAMLFLLFYFLFFTHYLRIIEYLEEFTIFNSKYNLLTES